MHTHPNSIKALPRFMPRDRVIRAYVTCRDTLLLTPKQTRLLLKGAALNHDIADAEQLYNDRSQ